MTEGCHGGWAIFQGFLAENGEIVSEECAPYTGKSGRSCKGYEGCPGIARVTNSYTLKNPTVESIQKEILYHGAVDVNWASSAVLHAYRKGVISSDSTLAQTKDSS